MAGLDQEPLNARSKHETTLIGLAFPHVCVCVCDKTREIREKNLKKVHQQNDRFIVGLGNFPIVRTNCVVHGVENVKTCATPTSVSDRGLCNCIQRATTNLCECR